MAAIPHEDRAARGRWRRRSDDSADLELAGIVSDFALTFERWTRSLIESDAPSLPRLRLLYALHCEGPQRMGDLADALEVTPRSVTALVDGLEKQGQVRRVPDPSDRRATIIELVDGRSDVEARYREHALAVAHLFDDIDARDRDTFRRVCEEIAKRLREAPARGT